MLKKKAIFIFALVSFVFCMGLSAGDTASFVNLGFSPDGNTYIFGQYGVSSANLRPWADMFIVDIQANNFIPGGRINYTDISPISAGQDGFSALLHILSQNNSLIQRNNVDFNIQGKPVFLALDDGRHGNTIEFRDFENNYSYRAVLVSTVEGQGENLRSSFYIDLDRTNPNGSRVTYRVGTPQLRRPLIESYRIRQVIVNPQNTSMIMVIEMRQRQGDSFNIRYMVEAVRF